MASDRTRELAKRLELKAGIAFAKQFCPKHPFRCKRIAALAAQPTPEKERGKP